MLIFKHQSKISIPKNVEFLRRRLFFTRETMLGVWVVPAQLGDFSQDRRLSYARLQLNSLNTSLSTKIIYFLLSVLVVTGVFMLVFLTIPDLYYRVLPAHALATVSNRVKSSANHQFEQTLGTIIRDNSVRPDESRLQPTPTPTPTPKLPAYDPNLPDGDWLEIPRIGVRSTLTATQNPSEALKTGLWLVPDAGRPGDTDVPMIVAAHRFGWAWWWQSKYWQYHSFNRLPETEPGDIVEVIADKRKWTYEIYAGEESDEITDYDADLILYTCKFLNSPVRYIRYARIIDSDAN